MKIAVPLFMLIFAAASLALNPQTQAPAAKDQPPVSATQPTPAVSATQQTNDAYVEKLKRRIAGHEKEPAEKVFKNIQIEWFKQIPAAQFLNIMNMGYSRALGVTCTHCHDDEDFSKDEKRPKLAAREMAVMHRSINDQLSKMQHLEPRPNHFINCNTCHRGAVNPTGQ